VRALAVIAFNPSPDHGEGVITAAEPLQPHAFLLHRLEEALRLL